MKGYETHLNGLLKKYEIQKQTLSQLASHKEATDEEKSKISAVVRFIEGFQSDINELKNLPF